MTIDPNAFNVNTQMAGLGAVTRLEESFSIPARNITTGTVYTHPVQYFETGVAGALTRVQIRTTSIDDKWRQPALVQYDRSNNYYLTANGFSIANGSTKFNIGKYIVYNGTQIGILIYLTNTLVPNATASIPQLDFDVRISVYNVEV